MNRISCWISVLAAAGLAGCATARRDAPEPPEMDGPSLASADIADSMGRVVARATAEEAGPDLRVRVETTGLAQGAYGTHIHTTGRCDAPSFAAAGPHWNPTGQMHGKDHPQGMHKGDLPNLLVGTDRRGSFEYTIPNARISGRGNALMDMDGAAVVIHQQPDDYRTDPSGNSGARIACGVLR